jgi:hypothetical protein
MSCPCLLLSEMLLHRLIQQQDVQE